VLITSSLVAVRGLINAMHGDFGFEPHNSMLVGADLHMAGYGSDRVPAMQKRMLDALSAIPGVESVGLTNELLLNDQSTSSIFSDKTTDLRPTNAALADVYTYAVSPEYLHAEHVDQIRSYHPWGLLMDEAAFQPQAGEAPRLHRIGPIVATHQQ